MRWQSVNYRIHQLSNQQLYYMMNKNWEDEFDFDDQAANNKTKRANDKKNKKNALPSNEFQGLDLEQKNVKFPVISSKVPNLAERSAKQINKVNLEEISGKKDKKGKNQQPDQFEEILQQPLAPVTSPLKPPQKQAQQKVKANTSTLKDKKLQQSTNQYANEAFDEPEYEEDFEAHEEKQSSPIVHRPKEQKKQLIKKSLNTIHVPKAAQNNRKGAQSVMKNSDNTARVYTRNSVRSQDRSFNSRTKLEQKKQEAPNKFTAIAEKNCPNYQKGVLEEFNMDKLVRQNEKIRNTIKKFNDQLNDMINRNILLLKGKKEEKVVDQGQVVKQLEELRASNQTSLQTTIKELSKLKDKEGALRQEEYHLTLDQRIQQSKNSISELSKFITKLNFDVSNQGNKLSKIDKTSKQGNPNTQINTVKMNLINMRKDEERNQDNQKKLELKFKELTQKMAELQAKFNQQVEGAKAKGINIATNPELAKRLEELKKKVDIGRQHKGKTEALFKTKADMIAHQLEQIRAQIKNTQSSSLSVRNNCEQFQEQSRKTVEKAKKGGKVPADLISSLQSIISEMERGVSSSKESGEQQPTFTQPKGAKKYQSLKNVEKVAAVSAAQKQQQKTQDDSNMKKPLLFKKKKQEDEKHEERVWKDEKAVSPPKNDKNRESAAELAKFQDKQPERKDQQKKKPFAFKKNKDKIEEQTKVDSPKPEVAKEVPKKEENKIQQPKKDEQAINLAPRMMRFKKNKQEPTKQEAKITPINDKNTELSLPKQAATFTNPIKIQQKEQENPIIVPKRFNLKLKDKKSEETGYVATNLQKKDQTKDQQPKRPVICLDQQKNAIKEVQKTINKIQASQEKPYFNLKLKDRQKEPNRLQNKQEQKQKVQLGKEQLQQPIKISISLSDNPNPMKENSNPYVQQEGVKRQREGPLRKQKPQQVAKQQISIFEQATEIDL